MATPAADIFNVGDKVYSDDTITQFELHTHLPYASQTFGLNDEIRIPIHQQDVYTLPSKSFLYLEGRVAGKKVPDNTAVDVKFVTNAAAFLFDEIRMEIAGVEVDRVRNVGITSTIKNLLSMQSSDTNLWENAGFTLTEKDCEADGKFSFCLPLRMLMGFFEDYRKILLNVKQELILLRSHTNANSVKITTAGSELTLSLDKVQWKMPYIHVADTYRMDLLQLVDSDRPIAMPFRSWQIHEYPVLPKTTIHNWTVKTTSQMEKPRYIAFALQTNRKNQLDKNISEFDWCDLHNIRLYLNSQYFPYDNLMGNKKLMYEMFVAFQNVYHNREGVAPAVTFTQFTTKTPIVLLDCSKQNETLKTGTVDVRLEFDTKENIPENTTAYCLIIYDTVVEYTPLSGVVRRIM
jgi:hypothetical protein